MMIGEIRVSEGKMVEVYELFCRKFSMDCNTPKSCHIFTSYLRHGRMLPENEVVAALGQIRQVYSLDSRR
jgi:hypothetical protein